MILGMITTTFYAMRLSHAKTEVSEMNDFLKDRLFGLAASESAVGFSADPNLRMLILLKDASEELDKRFPQQSELKSDLQRALARSFRRIGEHQESTKLFADYLEYLRSKHGLRHPDSIWVMAQMVQNYIEAGELDLAQEDCDLALRYCNALGQRHELTAQLRSLQGTIAAKRGRFQEAKEILEESLMAQRRNLGSGHASTLSTQSELAVTLEALQDFATAERLHRETLSAYVNGSGTAKRREVAEAQALLGKCLLNRSSSESTHSVAVSGEPIEEAVRLLEMSWGYFQEVRGRYDPHTLDLQLHLASGFCEQRRLKEAESLLLDLRQRMVGLPRMEANMVQATNLLGWSYLEQEEFAKADAILDEAWELVQRHDPNSPQAVQVMSNLAIARNLMGKLESALELDQQVSRLAAEVFGGAHRAAVAAKVRLALGYFELGRHREGQTLLEGCLADERARRAIEQQDGARKDLTETLAVVTHQKLPAYRRTREGGASGRISSIGRVRPVTFLPNRNAPRMWLFLAKFDPVNVQSRRQGKRPREFQLEIFQKSSGLADRTFRVFVA